MQAITARYRLKRQIVFGIVVCSHIRTAHPSCLMGVLWIASAVSATGITVTPSRIIVITAPAQHGKVIGYHFGDVAFISILVVPRAGT